MSTWVLQSQSGELLTVPYVLPGERIKRLVDTKTGAIHLYGILTLSPKKQAEILTEMTAGIADEKVKQDITARAELLLSALNDSKFEKIAKTKTKVVKLNGIIVSTMFYGNNVSFLFKKQKGVGQSAAGNDKTVKVNQTSVSTKEIAKANAPQPDAVVPASKKQPKRAVKPKTEIKVAKVSKVKKTTKPAPAERKKLKPNTMKALLASALTSSNSKKQKEQETVNKILEK